MSCRDKELARKEAAYIEEDEARDDYVDIDDPLYEHIRTVRTAVIGMDRDKPNDDDGQIHSNGHVTVDIENDVGDVEDLTGGISFDPSFETAGQRNSRVIISDNGLYR